MKGAHQKTGSSLLPKLDQCIAANLKNEQFGVDQLASEIGMSRSNLYRKLKALENKNISQYIREFRLKEARRLLLETELNTGEIAHEVGFGSVSYFSRSFSEFYGCSPSKARSYQMKDSENISKNTFRIKSRFIWVRDSTIILIMALLTLYSY